MAGSSLQRRILVTGKTGQVGEALTRTLAPFGELFTPGRADLDVASPNSIRKVMRDLRPHWVVNAAAYTAVDKAESEPADAFAINAVAPAVFALQAQQLGTVFLHFSTDYVFDGTKVSPYLETDPTRPLNVYGNSKLEGESALRTSGAPHLIFRTSWVFGATGKNFLQSILKLARQREELKIVADQHGAPTWSFDLARMTAHVIERIERSAVAQGCTLAEAALPVSGVYHATGAGETTWCGFAEHIVSQAHRHEPETKFAKVEPISSSEYPTPAKRPMNSRLDCFKLKHQFDWAMPDWRNSVAEVIALLQREG